jgi:hypothetical protein
LLSCTALFVKALCEVPCKEVEVPLHIYIEVTTALIVIAIRRSIVPTGRLQTSREALSDILKVAFRSAAAVEFVIGTVAVIARFIALVVSYLVVEAVLCTVSLRSPYTLVVVPAAVVEGALSIAL